MNPWVIGVGCLLVGVCVGKWFSARKQVAAAVSSLQARFDVELQGARASAAAAGGNVVMLSPGRLDELLGNGSAHYDRAGDYDDHVHNIVRASVGALPRSDGLGSLDAAGVVPHYGRDLVPGGAAMDFWGPPVIER